MTWAGRKKIEETEAVPQSSTLKSTKMVIFIFANTSLSQGTLVFKMSSPCVRIWFNVHKTKLEQDLLVEGGTKGAIHCFTGKEL